MALLQTDKLSAFTQTFRQDRQMFVDGGLQEGVVGAGDLKVTPGGASLQWSVAAGSAWAQGDDTTRQGLYHQVNDAAVTGTIAAGHATLPRIDQVVLQIADSSVTGVSNTPTLITVPGTATSGATLDNRNGAAALPNSAVRLADILVPAAQSGTISAANIRDRRPWAYGAQFSAAGDNTVNATTTATAAPGTLFMSARIECSGKPLLVTFVGRGWNTGAGATVTLYLYADAGTTFITASALTSGAANEGVPFTVRGLWTPPAGSHVIEARFAASATTATIQNASGFMPVFTIEELLLNAANT